MTTLTACHNPACRQTVAHSEAFLRSVSLVQVAFCSLGCVEVFGQLDEAVRARPIPEQRRPVDARIRR